MHGEGSARPARRDERRRRGAAGLSRRAGQPGRRRRDDDRPQPGAEAAAPAEAAPAPPAARGSRRRCDRGRPHTLLYVLLAALVFALVLGGLLFLRDDDAGASGRGSGASAPIALAGIASYDPEGDDGAEHPEAVASAADGDPASYWTTSTYQDFSATKSGVGVVLDAGSPRDLSSVTVTTDTPGYTAEIKASDSPTGNFRTVGESKTVGATTTWELKDAKARYLLVWITDLDGRAHVNEVKAR